MARTRLDNLPGQWSRQHHIAWLLHRPVVAFANIEVWSFYLYYDKIVFFCCIDKAIKYGFSILLYFSVFLMILNSSVGGLVNPNFLQSIWDAILSWVVKTIKKSTLSCTSSINACVSWKPIPFLWCLGLMWYPRLAIRFSLFIQKAFVWTITSPFMITTLVLICWGLEQYFYLILISEFCVGFNFHFLLSFLPVCCVQKIYKLPFSSMNITMNINN